MVAIAAVLAIIRLLPRAVAAGVITAREGNKLIKELKQTRREVNPLPKRRKRSRSRSRSGMMSLKHCKPHKTWKMVKTASGKKIRRYVQILANCRWKFLKTPGKGKTRKRRRRKRR